MSTAEQVIRFKAGDNALLDLVDEDKDVVRALGFKAVSELLAQALRIPYCYVRVVDAEFKKPESGKAPHVKGVEIRLKGPEPGSDKVHLWKGGTKLRRFENKGLRSSFSCLGRRAAEEMVAQAFVMSATGDAFTIHCDPNPEGITAGKNGKVPSRYLLMRCKNE